MQSNRRGQANSALSAVQGRHEAIQKIERQMIELAQLFQDVDAAIVEQEAPVQAIETGVEKTHENIQGGNKQLDGAIKKAKSIRRKKWICLGIVVAIIAVIVIIILILRVRSYTHETLQNLHHFHTVCNQSTRYLTMLFRSLLPIPLARETLKPNLPQSICHRAPPQNVLLPSNIVRLRSYPLFFPNSDLFYSVASRCRSRPKELGKGEIFLGDILVPEGVEMG